MKKYAILAVSILSSSFLSMQAQYTEVINSNRPGTSQGAFAVGNQVLQLETGYSMGKEEHTLLKTKTDAFTIDYALRYGFLWEELEISFMGTYLSENTIDNRSVVEREYKTANFRSNTLGAKYLIYDPYKKRMLEKPNLYSWKANNTFQWRELIPAISVYAGVNFDMEDNPFVPINSPIMSPKGVISTQNNFNGGWVFVTNIIADRIGTDYPTYAYIITLTHAFNPKFSMFVENQGIKSDFYADQIFRFGGAFLFTKDFQVDLLASLNFKDTPSKYYGGIGVSYRFDMHAQDKYIGEGPDSGGKEKKKRENDFEGDELDGGK